MTIRTRRTVSKSQVNSRTLSASIFGSTSNVSPGQLFSIHSGKPSFVVSVKSSQKCLCTISVRSCKSSTFPWSPTLHFFGFGAAGASHDNPRTQDVHIREGPGASKNHQNSTRRHPERDKKSENGCGRGKKKARNFGPPLPSGPHHDTHQIQNWIGQNWIGQNGIGQNQSLPPKHLNGHKPCGDVFTRKNTDFSVCPSPSVFLCCFISVCLGFPLCVVFFVFFCSSLPGNAPWLSFCAPTSMVLDIAEGQRRGRAKNGRHSLWGKNIEKIGEAPKFNMEYSSQV